MAKEKKRKQADEKKMETVFCLVVNLVKSLGVPRNLMMMEYYWTSHAWPTFWRAVFFSLEMFSPSPPPYYILGYYIHIMHSSFSCRANILFVIRLLNSLFSFYEWCKMISDLLCRFFFFMQTDFLFFFNVVDAENWKRKVAPRLFESLPLASLKPFLHGCVCRWKTRINICNISFFFSLITAIGEASCIALVPDFP